jgi:hypothetical protein
MRATKWTNDMRVIVFKAMKNTFGEYNGDWSLHPNGMRDKYFELIDNLITTLKVVSGYEFTREAIEMQIRFGTTSQRSLGKTYICNWVLNTAAAIQAGYVSPNYLNEITLNQLKP